jgi:hypothetical protein
MSRVRAEINYRLGMWCVIKGRHVAALSATVWLNIPFRGFRAFTAKWSRTALFWSVTQRVVEFLMDVSGQHIGPIYKDLEAETAVRFLNIVLTCVCVCAFACACSSLNVIVVIKYREMKWTRHVVRVGAGEIGETRTLKVRNLKGRRHLEGTRCRCLNNSMKTYVMDKDNLRVLFYVKYAIYRPYIISFLHLFFKLMQYNGRL